MYNGRKSVHNLTDNDDERTEVNMEKKQSSQKAKQFFKKNVYYIIMAVCLLAIAAMVTVTVLINNGVIGGKTDVNNPDNPVLKPNDDPVVKPDDNPVVKPDDDKPNDKPEEKPEEKPTAIVFGAPVKTVNVIQKYSMDALVWNSTLKHYAVHNGIDFGGKDGDNVLSCYDGEVTSVTYDVLNGHTVTIKHNDKISTIYSSLNEPTVKVGQKVNKGTIIGTMGVTATAEYSLGAHVHFSVTENGEIINPETYLTMTESK